MLQGALLRKDLFLVPFTNSNPQNSCLLLMKMTLLFNYLAFLYNCLLVCTVLM